MAFIRGLLLWSLLLLISCAAGDLLDDIETALENAVDCAGGQALMVPLKALAALGNDAFVDTIVTICQHLNVMLFLDLLGSPTATNIFSAAGRRRRLCRCCRGTRTNSSA